MGDEVIPSLLVSGSVQVAIDNNPFVKHLMGVAAFSAKMIIKTKALPFTWNIGQRTLQELSAPQLHLQEYSMPKIAID